MNNLHACRSVLRKNIKHGDKGNLMKTKIYMSGIEAITTERQRQIEKESWTPEHDDTHVNGQMAKAAAAYALHGTKDPHLDSHHDGYNVFPWDKKWWKPNHFTPSNETIEDLMRNLEKAGALCIAEWERLKRLKAQM